MNKILYVLLTVVVVVVAIWLVKRYISGPKGTAVEKFDEETSSKPQVILFHAKWCKYCVEYLSNILPESGKNAFDTATDAVGEQIIFKKADVDDEKALAEQYNVTSFPTIVGVSTNGTVLPFDGDRNDVDAIVSFANTL